MSLRESGVTDQGKRVSETETDQASPAHPMVHAIAMLAADMLSTFAFLILFAVFHDVLLATAVAIVVGAGQIGRALLARRTVEPLQWLSLGLVVVLGGATLLTHNPRFIMVKPTLTYAALGVVMLRPGWMNRYASPKLARMAGDTFYAFGFIWAGVMLVTAVLNLVFALAFSPAAWTWFLFLFPLVSKTLLVAAQYWTTRILFRRRVRAAGPLAA